MNAAVATRPVQAAAEAKEATRPNESESQALGQCRVAAKAALDMLRKARDLDEALVGGNTLRLTRLAMASISPVIDDDEWSLQELRNWVFDVDAIILGALNVTDDELSEDRRNLLSGTHKLLSATASLITEDALKASCNASTTARLKFIAEALRDADRKIEHAYDKAEQGEALCIVLEHLSHDLMTGDALRMLNPAPTQADAAANYEALFKVIAVLDGAIALAQGTLFEPYLRETWEQLDAAQTACDPVRNKDLPVGKDKASEAPCDQLFTALAIFQTAAAVIESQWEDADVQGGAYQAAAALMQALGPKFEAQAGNPNLTQDDCYLISADVSVVLDLLQENCEAWDNLCLWGAKYLLNQCKDLVDTVEFPKEVAGA